MLQGCVFVFIVGVSLVTARKLSKMSLLDFALPSGWLLGAAGAKQVLWENGFVVPQGEIFLVYRMSVACC